MIDMTQNRVPYGLLTDEEKAALLEHAKAGGTFTWTDGYFEFRDIKNPSWDEGCVYRPVPRPLTQDEIAWDRLPEWVEWVARDEDGKVYCSEDYPGAGVSTWLYSQHILCRRIDDFPGIIIKRGTCDWRDSKQRRPK